MSTTGGGGDVPGVAVAVGYLVMLPLILLGCTLVFAVAGVLLQGGSRLHCSARHMPAEDPLWALQTD